MNLICEGISKQFGGIRALDNVDATFSPNKITAIIGPNGAGKTTLLNVISGLERPDHGQCKLGCTRLSGLRPYEIVRLGVARTFQQLKLVWNVSVLENVMLSFPRQRGEGLLNALSKMGNGAEERLHRERAWQLLESVGLVENVREMACELSYGQQKLLSLACLIATDAKAILLDEPISGIYGALRSRVMRILLDLRDSGKVIVFIEHDVGSVRYAADYVIAMSAGKVIADGEPSGVLAARQVLEAYLG